MIHSFHVELRSIIDEFVDSVYRQSKKFPKNEIFGATSQIRRAALSIALNYVEGYGRGSKASNRHFLEISYGSLKETEYLIRFSCRQDWILVSDQENLLKLSNRIGGMIWSTIQIKKRDNPAS
jgi:four helix bundle protein